MHSEGKALVKAPPDRVWRFISNPESIAQCFPNVEEYRVLDGKRTEARVRIGAGLINGTFNVKSQLVEEDYANRRLRCLILGSGLATTMKADIQINCIPHPEGTELVWNADATVGGLLGSFATRLAKNSSQQTVNQILDCIARKASEPSID
jgi:uncharacterized protein